VLVGGTSAKMRATKPAGPAPLVIWAAGATNFGYLS